MTDEERLPAVVFPVIVAGSQIAHLAVAELDADGAGYRAICPGGRMPLDLRRAEEFDVFIWCTSCREWAEASGITLPRSQ